MSDNADNENKPFSGELTEASAQEMIIKARAQMEASQKPDPIEESQKIYKEGVDLANQGLWQAAAVKFAKSIALHENGSAIENLASILCARCLYVEAEKMYENARRLWNGLGAKKNADRISEAMEDVRAVTMEFYHSSRNTKVIKELFENECDKDFSKFAKKAFEMTVGQKEEYVKFFFYDELAAIKQFDDIDDYAVIDDLIRSYTQDTLDTKLEEAMTFEESYEDYEAQRNRFYGMLNTFEPRDIQGMRAQVLSNIAP